MKLEEKKAARKLRAKGYSINEICNELCLAKGSVSIWVRDIELTAAQQQALSKKGIQKAVIEQRRSTRLKNENARRQIIIDAAQRDVKHLSPKELWLIGTMLYWAEGGKTGHCVVRFSNSDPEMIRLMMEYFRRLCKVPEEKFRGHIHIHPHLDHKRAESYWSAVAGIPPSQFYKTYRKVSRASKQKKDTLPFGTFDIYICSTKLFLKIYGWVQGIFKAY